MQVISSRSINSTRSSSRPQRKGLSLTCRTRCNSLPKSQQFSSSQHNSQTQLFSQTQTNISLKMQKQPQVKWIKKYQKAIVPVISGQSKISQMPKIVFRYTNDSSNNIQLENIFSSNNMTQANTQINRGRFFNNQSFHQVVISKSIETKNLSKSKINSQVNLPQNNQNKQLIDSRRVDRQIIEQKVYQTLPYIDQNMMHINLHSVKNQNISYMPSYQSKDLKKVQISNNERCKVFQQNLSPYHLLISSAKKCQSKQVSPSLIKQHQNQCILQISSLQNIPQVHQFNANFYEEEYQIASLQTNKIKGYVQNLISVSNCQSISEKSISNQNIISNKAQQNVDVFTNNTEEKILGDKNVNFVQVQTKASLQKQRNIIRGSPEKKIYKKQLNSVLQNIQNKPPETKNNGSMSGRRNIKRMKEIQKRLEEIITICNHNL